MKPIKVRDKEELSILLDSVDPVTDMEYEEYTIQCDNIGSDMILTAGPAYYLEKEQLLVIEGTYMNKEADGYVADWALTLVYEWNDADKEFDQECASTYLYFEQDPPITTLHNFLRITAKPEV